MAFARQLRLLLWKNVKLRKRQPVCTVLFQFLLYSCMWSFKMLLLGRITLIAQRPIVIKLSRGRYVHLCKRRCIGLSSALWKNGGLIRMPFGIIGRMGPGMRQLVGFGDRSTGRDTFGGEFGVRHCNQCGLYGIRVQQCCDVALFPNYFGQTR